MKQFTITVDVESIFISNHGRVCANIQVRHKYKKYSKVIDITQLIMDKACTE